MIKPPTERDIETLEALAFATRNHSEVDPDRGGWVMPMDCGGFNGSHHSKTLAKLASRGLCERKKYGGPRVKGSCRYRISEAGKAFLKALKPD